MTRYSGLIGFAKQVETSPGVWEEEITERHYKGDVTRNQTRWSEGSEINDEFRIDNEVSIVRDPFLDVNLPAIRYVTWMGSKWKVTSIQIREPRLILQIGGVYHGHETVAAPETP